MNLIFLGPPGVGKGTYASRIGPEIGIPHISTGDLFREEVRKESKLGKEVHEYMKAGHLVPDELTIEILKKRISGPDCKKGFILDGFPRTVTQAEELESVTEIDLVVNLKLPKTLLIKKLSARRICRNCGKIYNIADISIGKYRMPPILPEKEGVCDRCGGELYQRRDDEREVIEKRLEVYEKQSEPLIDFYKKKKLLVDVNVTGGKDVMVPVITEIIKKHGKK